MFGWEFPPFMSGGLGTACFGITKSLAARGVEIIFVLPKIPGAAGRESHVRLISAADTPLNTIGAIEEMGAGGLNYIEEFPPGSLQLRIIQSALKPYLGETQYKARLEELSRPGGLESAPENQQVQPEKKYAGLSGGYGPDLMSEAVRFGEAGAAIARSEIFDVIHCHDWMTVFAGVKSKEASGRPFVLHIHALEVDRSGDNINQVIFDIERYGMERADQIIAVSHYTRERIVNRYGIDPGKITVVHNAVVKGRKDFPPRKGNGRKIVLFLGRITFQKGPDYFVEAAARVLQFCPDVVFVMAGAGDMRPRMVERAAELGIGKSFHFPGFLGGAEIEEIYAMSDIYVMPSVSEPFGISPLEAMLYDVPVIISKQSGVAEILHHALKVDFWDVQELAGKIISILRHPALSQELVERSREEIKNIHWDNAAMKIIDVYNKLAERSQ
jgi:glycosyltransferase involved in cell wall biosynthesis